MINKIRRYFHTIRYLKLKQILGRLRYYFNKSKLLARDRGKNKLQLYNLHYHNNPTMQLIASWISENPFGQGVGWEPYPVSLRIVNWIKWDINGHSLSVVAKNSLKEQGIFLKRNLEWHILGNHLFENAKALIFAGLYFSNNRLFNKGYKILTAELKEQILPDGAHFELSPMYHSIILADMLDLVWIMKFYKREIPMQWLAIINMMFCWLGKLTHPDGDIAFFNDAAHGVALTYEQLKGYAQKLGISLTNYVGDNCSGYWRLERGQAVLIADAAAIGPDYLPGHAHADSLSFELSLNKQRLIVNSGVSCYNICPERLKQRGTAAHNTVVIDDKDSSEVWSSFRVAKRARVFDVSYHEYPDHLLLQATHNGYKKILHKRTWKLYDNHLLIEDNITGCGIHKVDSYLHFIPGVKLFKEEDNIVVYYYNNKVALIKFSPGDSAILNSNYYPGFDKAIPNLNLRISIKTQLPVQLQTCISFF